MRFKHVMIDHYIVSPKLEDDLKVGVFIRQTLKLPLNIYTKSKQLLNGMLVY